MFDKKIIKKNNIFCYRGAKVNVVAVYCVTAYTIEIKRIKNRNFDQKFGGTSKFESQMEILPKNRHS